jgi:hypothetical protein
VVLFGVKLGLALREEHRLRVFENRVLRRTFGQKMDEVTGGWRKPHNEELHIKYFIQYIFPSLKISHRNIDCPPLHPCSLRCAATPNVQ